MPADPLARVRRICLALPEVDRTPRATARPRSSSRARKTFVMYLDDHHGDGRLALWCAAAPGCRRRWWTRSPTASSCRPTSATAGWIGVRLDRDLDWDEVAGVVADAYRVVAPKRLLALLP